MHEVPLVRGESPFSDANYSSESPRDPLRFETRESLGITGISRTPEKTRITAARARSLNDVKRVYCSGVLYEVASPTRSLRLVPERGIPTPSSTLQVSHSQPHPAITPTSPGRCASHTITQFLDRSPKTSPRCARHETASSTTSNPTTLTRPAYGCGARRASPLASSRLSSTR